MYKLLFLIKTFQRGMQKLRKRITVKLETLLSYSTGATILLLLGFMETVTDYLGRIEM